MATLEAQVGDAATQQQAAESGNGATSAVLDRPTDGLPVNGGLFVTSDVTLGDPPDQTLVSSGPTLLPAGPTLVMAAPVTIQCEGGAELVAKLWVPDGAGCELRTYGPSDWRVVDDGQDPETATVHGNFQVAWYSLVLAFRSAGLHWWTQQSS